LEPAAKQAVWWSKRATAAVIHAWCVRLCYTPPDSQEVQGMAPAVQLDHVSKAYEQKVAVHDLNLQIEAGSMFGLLGPNGAGKTSSIRMMVGITLPDSGTVSLFGRTFTRESLKKVGLPSRRARAFTER